MLIPNGWAQANLIYTGAGLPTGAQVTFGLNVETYPGSPTDLANDIATEWANVMDAQWSSQVAVTGVKVKFGPTATGDSGEVLVNIPGTGSTTAVPSNTSLLVTKVTGVGGRQGRGRMYLPGLVEASVDSAGVVTPANLAIIQGKLSTFRTAMNSAGAPLALLHGEDAPIVAPYLVTGLVANTRVATQRRRLRR